MAPHYDSKVIATVGDSAAWSATRIVDLVHSLQLERGATCASMASCSFALDASSLGTASFVAQQRQRTNALLEKRIPGPLSKARHSADLSRKEGTPSCQRAKLFLNVLHEYNEIVNSLVERVSFICEENTVLYAMIRLKEYYAQQRGFIAGVTFLGDDAVAALPWSAFASFVALLGKQRALLENDLAEIADSLVVEDEAMQLLLSRMDCHHFSLAQLRARREDLWHSWSKHVDKLHSCEKELIERHASRLAKVAEPAAPTVHCTRKLHLLAACVAGLVLLVRGVYAARGRGP